MLTGGEALERMELLRMTGAASKQLLSSACNVTLRNNSATTFACVLPDFTQASSSAAGMLHAYAVRSVTRRGEGEASAALRCVMPIADIGAGDTQLVCEAPPADSLAQMQAPVAATVTAPAAGPVAATAAVPAAAVGAATDRGGEGAGRKRGRGDFCNLAACAVNFV